MNRFYVDAECDGLYGAFLSVAAMVTDENGRELDRFYVSVRANESDIQTDWVREHVLPYLANADEIVNTEDELLDSFWEFWMKHRESAVCIAYVQYPVEARLFSQCVMKAPEERTFLGPYPLYDLSTLLVARGLDPDQNMAELSGMELTEHDAMNDVRMMAKVWEKLIK